MAQLLQRAQAAFACNQLVVPGIDAAHQQRGEKAMLSDGFRQFG